MQAFSPFSKDKKENNGSTTCSNKSLIRFRQSPFGNAVQGLHKQKPYHLFWIFFYGNYLFIYFVMIAYVFCQLTSWSLELGGYNN